MDVFWAMAVPPYLGPPGAPSWPEVAIFDGIWGHFGLILGTGGVFSDACRLQELKKEGSGRHSEPEPLFSSFWDLPQGAQEGSRCSGSSVFVPACVAGVGKNLGLCGL